MRGCPENSVVFQGFTVVPLKLEETSSCLHYLYVKDHNVRDADQNKPKDRTLFVLNVPAYCDKAHIEDIFCGCGKVERVYLHKKPTAGLPAVDKSKFFPTAPLIQGYKVAYVVFKKASSVQAAKSLPYDKPLVLQRNDGPTLSTGLNKWCQQYAEQQKVDTTELQNQIEEYMAEFDRKAEEELAKAKELDGVPDEEGWVTVTRHGKNKAAPRTEAHERAITKKEKKRRKEKELLNFYSFQIRESKREQIATLRKKFEEDKQRISLMKASRKFKPY